MRIFALVLVSIGLSATSALAQQAEAMTCGQAIEYFARYGVIYKQVHGKTMPIRKGIPIAQPIACYGPNRQRFTYRLQTLDNPRCVISHYCSLGY